MPLFFARKYYSDLIVPIQDEVELVLPNGDGPVFSLVWKVNNNNNDDYY